MLVVGSVCITCEIKIFFSDFFFSGLLLFLKFTTKILSVKLSITCRIRFCCGLQVRIRYSNQETNNAGPNQFSFSSRQVTHLTC